MCFAAGRLVGATHIASNGFLTLKVVNSTVSGAIELAIRDGNGKVTWGELKSRQTALQNYVRGHLHFTGADGPCRLDFSTVQVNDRVDGSYLWLPLTAECGGELRRLSIDYTLLDAEDPSHRGLLTLFANGAAQTAVLGGAASSRQFELNHFSAWSAGVEYLRAGI